MKTAGQTLQEIRLSKRLELEDIARVTRIRPQFLELVEADNYRKLSSGTVARGFIRNYAEFLGLKPDYILAIFRRDFVENDKGEIVPRGMVNPINKVSIWTPKSTVIATVVAIFLGLGVYLFYQFNLLVGPPHLSVDEPKTNITTQDNTILISGQTDPEATIKINDQPVALDKGGTFSLRVSLTPGQNKITVIATGKSRKATTMERNVTLTGGPQKF